MKKRKTLIIFVLILTIALFGLLIKDKIGAFMLAEFPQNDCIKEYRALGMRSGKDYVKGEIIVGFKEGINEDQAHKIVDSLGLSIKDFFTKPVKIEEKTIIVAMVNVPDGNEVEWICRLRENPQIEGVSVNGIGHID